MSKAVGYDSIKTGQTYIVLAAMLEQIRQNNHGQAVKCETLDDCYRFLRMIGGDSFATEKELASILSDSWGFLDIIEFYLGEGLLDCYEYRERRRIEGVYLDILNYEPEPESDDVPTLGRFCLEQIKRLRLLQDTIKPGFEDLRDRIGKTIDDYSGRLNELFGLV